MEEAIDGKEAVGFKERKAEVEKQEKGRKIRMMKQEEVRREKKKTTQ